MKLSRPSADDAVVLSRGAAVNLLGMLAKTSKVLFTLFVTRVCGSSVFGIYSLAVAVVDLAARASIFGMDKSLLKFIPEYETGDRGKYDTVSAVFGVALAIGLPLTLLLVLFAPWISLVFMDKPEVATPLQIMALAVVPLTLLSLVLSAMKAIRIMAYDAFVTGIAQPLLILLLAIPILWVNNPAIALAFAHTIAAVVAFILGIVLFTRHYSLSRSVSYPARTALRRVLSFSTPLGLHDFVQYLAAKSEMFVLAFFVATADLGMYALAVELASVSKKIRQTFDPILIPVISEFESREMRLRVRENIVRVVRWILTIAIPIAGVMMFFSRPLLNIFGPEFGGGSTVLAMLCVSHLINANAGLLDTAMLVSGRPVFNLLNACILLTVQVTLCVLLVPSYGIVGAALAAFAAAVLVASIRLCQSLIILKLNPVDRTQLKPIGAGLSAALSTELLRRMFEFSDMSFMWVGFAVFFVLVYCIILYLLGIEPDDRYAFARLVRKA